MEKEFGRPSLSANGKDKINVPTESTSNSIGGKGGMPDISQLMNDPMIMQMTQNLMKNPEFMKSMSSMAQNMQRNS
jgi:hypothetical protein